MEHGAGILPAGGSDVPVPRVVFLSVPVYKGKLGPRQPAGIFRVLLEMDLRVGGVDLQLVHLQPLAVRLHPGVHHHRLGTGHLVPVQLDGEREGHSFPLRRLSGLSRPVHCRGPVFRFPCWFGRFHGAHGQELLREFPPAEMELRVPQFLRLSGRSAVLGGAVSLQGGAVRRLELPGHPAAALHRIEQVCPGWGGDDILRSNGDPVRPLCPADILHIVVLHRRPQAG